MFSLVYVSTARNPFSQEQLVELLQTSRRNNTMLGITGMLLYKSGQFMQAIEGDETRVRQLYEKIARDERHTDVLTLIEGPVEARSFENWTMGFTNLDGQDSHGAPAYSEFLETPLTHEEFGSDPSRAQRLLLIFKDY